MIPFTCVCYRQTQLEMSPFWFLRNEESLSNGEAELKQLPGSMIVWWQDFALALSGCIFKRKWADVFVFFLVK